MSANEKPAKALRLLRGWADLIVALGLMLVASTYLSIDQHNNGFFVILASIPTVLGYLIGTVIASIVWLVKRRWGRMAASATKFAAFLLLCPACIAAGDYIHLILFYPFYHRQIESQESDDATPVRFFWGDKGLWVTDGLQTDTLVYDPTDALGSFIGEVRDAADTRLGLSTRHLIGHFYVEREFSR